MSLEAMFAQGTQSLEENGMPPPADNEDSSPLNLDNEDAMKPVPSRPMKAIQKIELKAEHEKEVVKGIYKRWNLTAWNEWWATEKQNHNPTDILVASALASFVGITAFIPLSCSLVHMAQNPDKALPLAIVVNNICGLFIHLGVLLLWSMFCFGTRHKTETQFGESNFWVHSILRSGLWGQNLMPGGFAPRLFACAMGLLMFVNQSLVTSMIVTGAKLQATKETMPRQYIGWPQGMGCRADEAMPADWRKIWAYRVFTKTPDGCYKTESATSVLSSIVKLVPKEMGEWIENVFQVAPYNAIAFYVKPTGEGWQRNLKNPWDLSAGTPEKADGSCAHCTVNTKLICKYQCAKWKQVAVQNILMKAGSIFTGAVFIERITNALTTRYGHILVVPGAKHADVKQAIELTLGPAYLSCSMKCTLCLIAFFFLSIFVAFFTPRADVNGYYTVDYYVTAVFAYAVIVSLFLRSVHPYKLTPIVFTQQLWRTGKDEFIGLKKGLRHTIDLYEWYHIDACDRARYLLHYARYVTLNKLPYYQPELEEHEDDDSDAEHSHLHDSKVPRDVLVADFAPGRLGIKALAETGKVTDILSGGQAHQCGVEVGMVFRTINDEPYTEQLLDSMIEGEEEYVCTFGEDLVGRDGRSLSNTDALVRRQGLLRINSRKLSHEEFSRNAPQKNVICIKSFCGHADVKMNAQTDKSAFWKRCRVIIKKGAMGRVLGKTHTEQLMVRWLAAQDENGHSKVKLFQHHHHCLVYHELPELTPEEKRSHSYLVDHVDIEIDPVSVLELNPEWQQLEDFVKQAKKQRQAEKLSKKGTKQY